MRRLLDNEVRREDAVAEPNEKNAGAVIVTFNPDSGVVERIHAISTQVERIIVVDNASGPDGLSFIKSLDDSIAVVRNSHNLGIATALNQGLRQLREEGYLWAITFDQDTSIWEDLFAEFRAVYRRFPEKEALAVIGAGYTGSTEQDAPRAASGCWRVRKTVITSGSLMSLAAFLHIGDFHDEFFIDHVDHDYCLRAWSDGYVVIQCKRPTMSHRIGNVRTLNLGFARVKISLHTSWRYYFRYRNHIFLAKRHFRRHPAWISKMLLRKYLMLLVLLVLSPDRNSVLREVWRGHVDGLRRVAAFH